MRDGVEGTFGAGPPVCIPNSSLSHARFNESTLMSRSCDLFSKGSRKCHPCALGFDDFACDLRRSGIALAVLVVKSIALAFECLSAEVARVDLAIRTLYGGFSRTCVEAVIWPSGPFESCVLAVLVTMP
jgi:hypothetical protein